MAKGNNGQRDIHDMRAALEGLSSVFQIACALCDQVAKLNQAARLNDSSESSEQNDIFLIRDRLNDVLEFLYRIYPQNTRPVGWGGAGSARGSE